MQNKIEKEPLDAEKNSKRTWGADGYSKWDQLEDSDQEEEASDTDVPKPTYFSPGHVDMDIKDANYLNDDTDVKRLKDLSQRDTEVWQVVVRKLRVWAKGTQEAVEPCRPYCMFVSCLYPDAGVLAHELSLVPEMFPSPSQVSDVLVKTMLAPPTGSQRRPGRITFSNSTLAGELFQSMRKIGVECSPLSESEGVDEMVRLFSDQLVKGDIARRGEHSDGPSVVEAGMPLDSARIVYNSAALFAESRAWEYVAEREVFQVSIIPDADVKRKTSDPGIAYISILGNDCMHDYTSGQGVFGVGLFFSRLDAEARLKPPGHEVFRDTSVVPRCSKTGLLASEIGHDLKRTKPRRFDMRTGLELQYKDADALKAHWPYVKKYARPLTELESGIKEGKIHWAEYEATLLLNSCTMMPFNEHDLIEEQDLKLVDPENSPLKLNRYPAPMEIHNGGSPMMASNWRLEWIERALKLSAMLAKDFGEKGFLRRPGQFCEAQVDISLTGKKEKFLITASPVYMVEEVAKAMERSRNANVESGIRTEQQIGLTKSQVTQNDQNSEKQQSGLVNNAATQQMVGNDQEPGDKLTTNNEAASTAKEVRNEKESVANSVTNVEHDSDVIRELDPAKPPTGPGNSGSCSIS